MPLHDPIPNQTGFLAKPPDPVLDGSKTPVHPRGWCQGLTDIYVSFRVNERSAIRVKLLYFMLDGQNVNLKHNGIISSNTKQRKQKTHAHVLRIMDDGHKSTEGNPVVKLPDPGGLKRPLDPHRGIEVEQVHIEVEQGEDKGELSPIAGANRSWSLEASGTTISGPAVGERWGPIEVCARMLGDGGRTRVRSFAERAQTAARRRQVTEGRRQEAAEAEQSWFWKEVTRSTRKERSDRENDQEEDPEDVVEDNVDSECGRRGWKRRRCD
ncbi:hypothetical protein C8R45DRAFT_928423 [Mycena sanguinolenta]|nr:hypothetical protein C8R45DRAFT_928423 [Mycena sanguinolenta]